MKDKFDNKNEMFHHKSAVSDLLKKRGDITKKVSIYIPEFRLWVFCEPKRREEVRKRWEDRFRVLRKEVIIENTLTADADGLD